MNDSVGRFYFIGILLIVMFLLALKWIQRDIEPAPVTPTRDDVINQNAIPEEEMVARI